MRAAGAVLLRGRDVHEGRASLALANLPERCFGELKVGKKTVKVVFSDALPCPAVGAKVTGDLAYLCQDTGEWTSAEYAFTRGQEAFCGRKPAEAAAVAKTLAAKITPGLTRQEVRRELSGLKSLEGGSTETYYLHPDTVLSVPFDEPDGGYGIDNTVSGPVEVGHRVLPKL